MIRREMGPFAGTVAAIGVLAIIVILLAVLGLVVVKALANSPWGVFTLAATIPIALGMGLYCRFGSPNRVLGSVRGRRAAAARCHLGSAATSPRTPATAAWFTFPARDLALMLIAYGFLASVLPVWLLLAPRGLPLDVPESGHHRGAGEWASA
ncbi:MAG: carbon starvation CstA family protein [Rhodospirillales bacterium]